MRSPSSSLAVLVVLLATASTGCSAEHPEEALVGSWGESEWRYERIDQDPGAAGVWTDGVRTRQFPAGQLVRHEAERWEFRPGGVLEIVGHDGEVTRGRWRLKGRGHVMTLRFPETDGYEVYKVQELDSQRMVLHYDVGLEARGIARLEFRRIDRTASASVASRGGRS